MAGLIAVVAVPIVLIVMGLVWMPLIDSVLIWMPLLRARSGVIGLRPALRRRSGRMAASLVSMVFVFLLRKCRGGKGK
jgi:hypothetical protein